MIKQSPHTDMSDGRCHFCKEKAEDRYYSGSHETYKDCDCEKRKEWQSLINQVAKIEMIAKDNLVKQTLENRIMKLKTEIDRLIKRRKEIE